MRYAWRYLRHVIFYAFAICFALFAICVTGARVDVAARAAVRRRHAVAACCHDAYAHRDLLMLLSIVAALFYGFQRYFATRAMLMLIADFSDAAAFFCHYAAAQVIRASALVAYD